MTRIIAGFAGSLPLAVPGTGTRPTSDRVREAIFSALESRDALQDSHVVDLYAGSGALGLEAASRGASSVTLVERAASAARICRENVARILRNAPEDAAPRIAVAAQAVQTFLDTSGATWDLALIDPPYDISQDELAGALAALASRMASEGIILVERTSKAPEPVWPAGIVLDRHRGYGDTTLWWAVAGAATRPRHSAE